MSRRLQSPPQRRLHHTSGSELAAYFAHITKFHVTKLALRELGRRNAELRNAATALTRRKNRLRTRSSTAKRQQVPAPEYLTACSHEQRAAIQQSSRHGGPDLRDLRGFPSPRPADPRRASASDRVSVLVEDVEHEQSTSRASATSKPGDAHFHANLNVFGIHHPEEEGYDNSLPPEPANFQEFQDYLSRRRNSIPDVDSIKDDFLAYKNAIKKTREEQQVGEKTLGLLEGKTPYLCIRARGGAFMNFHPIEPTEANPLSDAKPDTWYGHNCHKIHPSILENLEHMISPYAARNPILPNCFLELKGPQGNDETAMNQAVYGGALGARGFAALQAFCQRAQRYLNGLQGSEPECSNARQLGSDDHLDLEKELSIGPNAHVVTCTLVDTYLKIHLSQPVHSKSPDRKYDYHTFAAEDIGFQVSASSFLRAMTAFRNARDWATAQREEWLNKTDSIVRDIKRLGGQIPSVKKRENIKKKRRAAKQASSSIGKRRRDPQSESPPNPKRFKPSRLQNCQNISSQQSASEIG